MNSLKLVKNISKYLKVFYLFDEKHLSDIIKILLKYNTRIRKTFFGKDQIVNV